MPRPDRDPPTSHLPTDPNPHATEFPFLAPPQTPGELGRLGPYRVLGVLGRGGMGMVFLAEDTKLRRQIAVKVMLPQFAASPQARARFTREARLQARVEHDHVAAIHHVEDAGTPYIAMPLLKGQSLAAALREQPRPDVAEAVRVAREIAEGLAAAHARGLVHRDVKPANVWLEGDRRRVKILDFGLTRVIDDPTADGREETEGPVTRDGAVVGTPAYMSPEQTRGESVDVRTDLFSLGVVLYQMTTGALPFQGASAVAVMMAISLDTPPPPAYHNPAVPPALNDLILRLLAKTPDGRPETAAAVVGELRQIGAALGGATVPDHPPTDGVWVIDESSATLADAPPARRSRWPWVEAGLLVAAGVAFAGWRMTRPAPPADPPVSPAPKTDPPRKPDPPTKTDPSWITLFDGKSASAWSMLRSGPFRWPVEVGYLETGPGDIQTKQRFRDCELHLEYWLAASGETAMSKRTNSGVYLQGRYEVQIMEDHDLPAGPQISGGLFGTIPPKQNASKPPGQWQTMDVTFIAPRTDTAGKVTTPGRLTVVHNGVKTLDNAPFDKPTDQAPIHHVDGGRGPIVLQSWHGKVRFRDVRVRVLNEPFVGTGADRKAAELLNPHLRQWVRFPSGEEQRINRNDPLPPGPFTLVRVHAQSVPPVKLPDDFVGKTLVPTLATLPGVEDFYDWTYNLHMTEDELARLAASPAAKTLDTLSVWCALTPRNIDTMKRFPRLSHVRFTAPDADDALLDRLKELPGLDFVFFVALGQNKKIGPKGIAAVTGMRVWHLSLAHCPAALDPPMFKAVLAMPTLGYLNLHATELGDAGLLEIAKGKVRNLYVTQTRVTADGVRKLQAARPDMRIEWDGGVIEPKDGK